MDGARFTKTLLGGVNSIHLSTPYWAALAGCLRNLRIYVSFSVYPDASSSLSQLTALEELIIEQAGRFTWGSSS